MPCLRGNPRRAAAFTLIEVVVVLLVFAVVVSMAAVITRAVTSAQKRSTTVNRMATVEAALAQFVAQQKRLPCPSIGTRATGHAQAGEEASRDATGCTSDQQHGVVPWRTLGLTETDATDGWDRRFTYRVHAKLAADTGMDMSWCDPAGTGTATGAAFLCNTACTAAVLANCTTPSNFLTGNNVAANVKGLPVRNVAGNVLMNPTITPTPHTGAAYVLISHGESGGGGYLYSGVLAVGSTTSGTEEARNHADKRYPTDTAYFVSDTLIETPATSHFDDIVVHPSILSVAARAGLGPRTH